MQSDPASDADLFGRIAGQAALRPEAPAFIIRGETHTYRAFLDRVATIAGALTRPLQRTNEPRVGVWTGDSLDTYASLLAAWSLRAAYVPINHTFPTERSRYMIERAGLKILLARHMTPALEAVLRDLSQPLQIIFTDFLPSATSLQLPAPAGWLPEQTAYLLFTSGSTGQPKGVPITQGNLAQFFRSTLDPELWGLSAEDRFLQMFDLTFDLSVFSTFAPLLLGACCCTVPEDGISYLQILDVLDTQRCTVALMVPSVLAYLHRYFAEIELPALQLSLFCGEALPAHLAQEWQQRIPHARLENVYGPTEATIFCTRYPITLHTAEEAHHGVVPIGKPFPGVTTRLQDEAGVDVQPGEEGELLLAGAQLTPGYWQNPEKNAEAFRNLNGQRYYRTGDRVSLSPGGDLLYHGRTDQQVKIDGYRVELGEIEHHARLHSGCDQVAVVPLPTPTGGWTLHLFLEGFHGENEILRQRLSQALPAYMAPRSITVLEKFPLNANGKIDRTHLRNLLTG